MECIGHDRSMAANLVHGPGDGREVGVVLADVAGGPRCYAACDRLGSGIGRMYEDSLAIADELPDCAYSLQDGRIARPR